MQGVSTHLIGSTALKLGRVVEGGPKDFILAPDQSRHELLLLEWVDGEIVIKASLALQAAIISELVPAGHNRWTFKLQNGAYYTVKAVVGTGG